MGTSVRAGTPLSVAVGVSSGVSSTGTVTLSCSSGLSAEGVSCSEDHSSATAGRADSSSGDSASVITVAADRLSRVPRSPSSQRRALTGSDDRRASAAEAAVSLPAVTLTAHSVPTARAPASSRRKSPEGMRFCLMCLTSWTTYVGGDGNMPGQEKTGPPAGSPVS